VADRLDLELCSGPVPTVGSQSSALTAAASCEDLTEILRAALIVQARNQVLATRCEILSTDCSHSSSGFWGCGVTYEAMDEATLAVPGGSQGSGTDGASEYSTTNTQEAGVDEADLVKNDAEHIYLATGSKLEIYQAWPAAETGLISSYTIDGVEQPQALYVFNDHAVIYSYNPDHTCYDSYNSDSWYGYGCITQDARTVITVLDITDRTQPRLARRIEIEGAYVSSRRIDSAVHTVVAFPGTELVQGLQYWGFKSACSYEDAAELDADTNRIIAENTQRINAAVIDNVLPAISDIRYPAGGGQQVSNDLFGTCSSVLVPASLSGASVLSVLSFDIGDETTAEVTSIVGEQGVVYASTDSLYVASVANAGYGYGAESTTVHRFALEAAPASTTYEASGAVGGRVLNQFSMGEQDGYLRMATTTGHLPSPDAFNSVYVLEQQGTALTTVGAVSPIGVTEDIRSARFIGDRGYVVTFKKTDPLFVIDLANPAAPYVAGELHIPGFSTYMHPMDENHLLTIGYDAEDQGDFAWFSGIQLQIFDVSDLSDPTLVHKHVIGTRGTASEAATNHLAFNYFKPKDLLALPMAICESGSGGSYGTLTFNGLMVFDVTTAAGFAEHGRIAHSGSVSCSSWWSDPVTNGVRRSIVMDDYVYSIANDQMIVAHLDDLSTPVASVTLAGLPGSSSW